ncbi:MAG TPA: MFS transporter [Stellaceae bacterium]|nr:MFS transporter [Stellaceae bacterium]
MKQGWLLVWALALAQVVSWGSIYYSFSLFVVPMERDLGWSREWLNGALSLGLLASGLMAYPVGALIDRGFSRSVMALGSLLGATLLALWSRVESVALFYLLWLGLGVALAATLYEPVFAVLTRHFPESYRTRITALTLIGGFASTVFVPLTQFFITSFGWRGALLALALCNLALALPVHALLLGEGPRSAKTGQEDSAARALDRAALRRALRHPVFWALAVCFTAYYANFAALTFHIIPLLDERHVPMSIIVAAIAVIGPAQVLGRIVLLALGRKLSAAIAGRIAFLAFPVSVLMLISAHRSTAALFAFAAVYGAANGVITIVRGLAVPELLGREAYGAINGALTLPANLARAAAPFGAALLWAAAGGYGAVLWAITAGGAVAAVAFWYAAAPGTTAARERRS